VEEPLGKPDLHLFFVRGEKALGVTGEDQNRLPDPQRERMGGQPERMLRSAREDVFLGVLRLLWHLLLARDEGGEGLGVIGSRLSNGGG